MDPVAMVVIAVGLAMDAFAVSIANSLSARRSRVLNALKMATFFGSFQAFMPLIGWLAGFTLSSFVTGVDHWVAFGFLSLIGCKMIYESLRAHSEGDESRPLTLYALLVLSVATSIDALTVGLSLAFLQVSVAVMVTIIGIVTFSLSFLGASFGNKIGGLFARRAETVGGIVLITIGVKIVLEHLL